MYRWEVRGVAERQDPITNVEDPIKLAPGKKSSTIALLKFDIQVDEMHSARAAFVRIADSSVSIIRTRH